MLSPGCRSVTPKLQVSDIRPRAVSKDSMASSVRRCSACAAAATRSALSARAADDAIVAGSHAADVAQNLVADVVAIGVVDALEVVDVEHDRGQRSLRLAALLGLLKEGATVEYAGQRIDHGEADQFIL